MPRSTVANLVFPSALLMASLASASVVTAFADDRAPPANARAAVPPALPLSARSQQPRAKLPVHAQPSMQHLYLICTTLLLLDNANRTGNYTVLRDTSGLTFQQKHSAADLAIAFQKIRGTVDLAHAAIETPQLTRPPLVTPEKQLHLIGILPGTSKPIAFEMVFEPIGGHWRLAALAVGATPG